MVLYVPGGFRHSAAGENVLIMLLPYSWFIAGAEITVYDLGAPHYRIPGLFADNGTLDGCDANYRIPLTDAFRHTMVSC